MFFDDQEEVSREMSNLHEAARKEVNTRHLDRMTITEILSYLARRIAQEATHELRPCEASREVK